MTQQRMPVSVLVSLAVHAAALAFFLVLMKEGPKQAARVVEGVDLLIQPARPREGAAKKPEALSMTDFLKLALPTAPPRRAEVQALAVDAPARRKIAALDAPKLEERARKDLGPKLETLDLSRSRARAATVEAEPMTRRQAAAALAALPKLEEVGRRRVRNLPEALALEERRREATAALGAADLSAAPPTTRRRAALAAAALAEAEPPARAAERKLDSLLPESLELKPAVAPAAAPKFEKIQEAPKLERRQAAVAGVQKKGVEIEGPLANRRVASYALPQFPDWASRQGIMEAEVAIRFTVDAAGAVMPGMTVERTSGYGRLDRLAMDHLRQWTFAPAPGTGAQWGVITFRFIQE